MGLYQNRIVVKVGTSTLTNEMGKKRSPRVRPTCLRVIRPSKHGV